MIDNWSLDERIEVSNDKIIWVKRHFAGIDANGDILVWSDGSTSWTTISKSSWHYARKTEE